MSRNEIISALFTGKNFNQCLQKMEPDHLREDLRQEVILVICELPEAKIIHLHESNALEFFTVRVILNQIKSNTSPFAKNYRQHFVSFEMMELSKKRVTEHFEYGNDVTVIEMKRMHKIATRPLSDPGVEKESESDALDAGSNELVKQTLFK